ncbi:MAG: Na+/H+ antiporter NhaC family protein [Chitinophagaceae bacterium]|nr:MAG: Na+/H+ antiporter NhaC family protein [Chitinophagaceae bacterium]
MKFFPLLFFILFIHFPTAFADVESNFFIEKSEEDTLVYYKISSYDTEALQTNLPDIKTKEIENDIYITFSLPVEGIYYLKTGFSMNEFKLLIIKGDESDLVINSFPAWLSLLPPLIAIFLALVFKEVIISLFIGVFSGVLLMNGGGGLRGFLQSFFDVVNIYLVGALSNPNHAAVIIFSLFIGGMVTLIQLNGGTKALVNALLPYAKNKKRSLLLTWLMGIIIFFDDYANTLIVGNTMKSVTDKFKISREKLAYIVDSTAAPVASIALITTWIGVELGYIADALQTFAPDLNPYSLFLASLKYSFYPFLTLIFILILILSGKDFGPMLKAEFVASKSKPDEVKSANTEKEFSSHPMMAILPVVVLLAVAMVSMFLSGYSPAIWNQTDISFFQKLSLTIGESDPYKALLQASLSGLILAFILCFLLRKKIQGGISAITESMLNGFKSMLHAVVILLLAWSLSAVTSDLNTAVFLSSFIGETVNPRWLPLIVFITSALIAFSTGSSWSTMAIIFPLALPVSWLAIGGEAGGENYDVLIAVISVVLAGAIWGDHCSPISDTTVLSSLATDCNHIAHVQTQLPYSMLVGIVSAVCLGPLFVFHTPLWIIFPLAVATLWLFVRFYGKYPYELPE